MGLEVGPRACERVCVGGQGRHVHQETVMSALQHRPDKTHKASDVRMKTFIITPIIPTEPTGAKGHTTGIQGGGSTTALSALKAMYQDDPGKATG